MDSIRAAKDSVYASTTHCSPDIPPPSAVPIDGSATFTTDASRVMSAKPRRAAVRVSGGEGGGESLVRGVRRVVGVVMSSSCGWAAPYSSGRNAIRPEVLAMVQPSRPRRVAVVAATPVSMFNLAIPELLFERVEVDGERGYETVICAPEPGPVPTTGGLDLHVRQGLDVVRDADLVLVVGTGHRYTPDPRTVSVLSEAAAAGKRIASICSGAFALAEAGLLDGRRATTYWNQAEEMRRRYPEVDLTGDVLYVQDGQFLTASGYAA